MSTVPASNALKPCPFCGATPTLESRDVEPQNDSWYGRKDADFVLCDCGACLFDGSFHEGFYDAETRAVEAWNRRSPESATPTVQAVSDPTRLLAWLEKKKAEAEIALRVREQSARVWSDTDDAAWREVGNTMSAQQRSDIAAVELRIAQRHRADVSMYSEALADARRYRYPITAKHLQTRAELLEQEIADLERAIDIADTIASISGDTKLRGLLFGAEKQMRAAITRMDALASKDAQADGGKSNG